MASSDSGLLRPAHGNETGLIPEIDDLVDRQAAVSAALASVFVGSYAIRETSQCAARSPQGL